MQHILLINLFVPFWKIYVFIFELINSFQPFLYNLWPRQHLLIYCQSSILVEKQVSLLISLVLNSQKRPFIIGLFLEPLPICPD